MKKYVPASFMTLGVAFGMVFAMSGAPSAAFAQATPASDSTQHPAHIHSGVCPEPGDVVFPLENVVPLGEGATETGMGTPAGTPDAMSSPVATPAMTDSLMGMGSTTTVEASLDDILAAEHAINLHLSPEEMSVYVACGDITGTPEDGELMIDLEELNDSGLSGQATLTDNGDGTTMVVLELRHVSVNMDGTPESTPLP